MVAQRLTIAPGRAEQQQQPQRQRQLQIGAHGTPGAHNKLAPACRAGADRRHSADWLCFAHESGVSLALTGDLFRLAPGRYRLSAI